jgi:hypothetical protein
MLGTNLSVQPAGQLTTQPSPASNGPADAAQSAPTDFEKLLQGLSQDGTSTESALPELLAVVASLAGSSKLLDGIEKPGGPAEPKDKKPPTGQSPVEGDPLATLQALLAMAPQICVQPGKSVTAAQEPKTSPEQPSVDLELATPKGDSPEKPVLNLKDFDVRRFEFKTEVEIAPVQPKLIRVAAFPEFMQAQSKPNPAEPKPGKGSDEVVDATPAAAPVFGGKHETLLIKAPEAVQRVQVAIDPPPPPPVARQISMDIGDPESQVRVVIRERNGDLAVQFGAATERLRENLQTAAPLLMQELRRDNPHTVSLDFSRFGTATEGGHESHQDSRRRKALKSEAVFADMDETAYLTGDIPSSNSF